MDKKEGNWFEKLLDWANKCYKKHNLKKSKKIHNLNSALSVLEGQISVIVWDTLWGTSTTIFIAMFVCFFEKANKVTMLGIILFNLIMLWSGHKILPKLSKRKFYDRKLFKYSRMYIDYPSHEEYRMQIEQSIRRGVLSYTGFWMLTDEFMLGRLGDITFEPVAIPRGEIERIVFFYEKSYESPLLGILQLQLKNGKVVELCMGRGAQDMSAETLQALQENGILYITEKVSNT